MKRTCADCGLPLLVKNTGREHHDARTGETSYRCRACVDERVRGLIVETRRGLRLSWQTWGHEAHVRLETTPPPA